MLVQDFEWQNTNIDSFSKNLFYATFVDSLRNEFIRQSRDKKRELNLIDREHLALILKEHKIKIDNELRFDEQEAIYIGRFISARYVLIGKIVSNQSQYLISAKIINAETTKIESYGWVDCNSLSVNMLSDKARELATAIVKNLHNCSTTFIFSL